MTIEKKCPLFLRTHSDWTGSTQIAKGNPSISRSLTLITSAKSLLPSKIMYSQILGIRVWTSLGSIILPTIGNSSYGKCPVEHSVT